MTSEQWQQIKRILEPALQLTGSARAAFLNDACEGDPSLRRDVESFLVHDETDDLLDQPAVRRAPAVADSAFESIRRPSGTTLEVCPIDLAPYTRLEVSTRSSRYELVVVAPLELAVLVKGGGRFPESTRARLYRQDVIAVGDVLRLKIGTRKVTTTTIQSIEIVDERRGH